MLLACFCGARALWRIRSAFDRLSLIVRDTFFRIHASAVRIRHRIRRIRPGRAVVLALQHAPRGACGVRPLRRSAHVAQICHPALQAEYVMARHHTFVARAPGSFPQNKVRPPPADGFCPRRLRAGCRLSAAKFAYRSARRHRQRRVRSYCALCDVGQTELRGVFYRGVSTDHRKPPKVRVGYGVPDTCGFTFLQGK